MLIMPEQLYDYHLAEIRAFDKFYYFYMQGLTQL